MIAGLIIVLTMTAAGLPLTALVAPSRPARSFLALSYLLGSALCALVLFALSLVHIRWSAVALATGVLVPLAICAPWAWRRLRSRTAPPEANPQANLATRLVDLLTLVSLCGYAIYATIAPMWEWDFWSLWGMMGRAFYEHGGIDWEFLARPENILARSDYSAGKSAFRPILHPLLLDAFATLRGGWDDRMIGLLFAAFAAAILLLVRDELERESGSPLLSAVAVLTMSGVVASRWVGNPEGMIVAYMMAAVLLTRRGLRDEDRSLIACGSLFAGLAAFTKDEGTTFVIAFIVAVALSARRNWKLLLSAWPAIAVPIPWFFLRNAGGVQSYFASSSLFDRIAKHVEHPGELLSALTANVPDRPLFWIGVILTLLVLLPAALRRETFIVTAIGLQLLFFLAAYLATPFEILWHVQTSWVRLLYQLAPALMFVAVVLLWPVARGDENS
jgi:hypothetical protein